MGSTRTRIRTTTICWSPPRGSGGSRQMRRSVRQRSRPKRDWGGGGGGIHCRFSRVPHEGSVIQHQLQLEVLNK